MNQFDASDVCVIAIDGPTASGKGAIAQAVADVLGFAYLDSGALYRLVALGVVKHPDRLMVDVVLGGGEAFSEEAVRIITRVAEQLDVQFVGAKIHLCGNEVTDDIRQESVGNMASRIAILPSVRAALLARQRRFAVLPGLVADGRDMASVIFPSAQIKVFLTADAAVRAQRRYKQLMNNGFSVNMDDLEQDLRARDLRDSTRAFAPLKPAQGAVVLDTSALSLEESISAVLELYRAWCSKNESH